MESLQDVPDSSDWLNTPVASLSAVESALRCEVCKDFYKDPVITSCLHTFCALCIRRCLSANGKCPLCMTTDEERKLRKNPVVGDLVKAFQAARPEILQLGRDATEARKQGYGMNNSRKRKRNETRDGDEAVAGRVTRSGSRRSPKFEATQFQTPDSEVIADVENSRDGNFQPEDGLAACPICNLRMPEIEVFTHLDTHPNGFSRKTGTHSRSFGQLQASPRKSAPPATTNPLPTIAYGVLNENQLRKKLLELKIPTGGSKETLKQRHIEWRNIYNANCDSSAPKSRRDLLRDLDQWEKSKEKAPNAIMEKEFDRDAWSRGNENQFQDLVVMARAKQKSPKAQDSATSTDKPGSSSNQDLLPNGEAMEGIRSPPLRDGNSVLKHSPVVID